MNWIDPVLALLLAGLFCAVLVGALGWRHPKRPSAAPSLLFLFLMLFPILWVGALWITPIGPTLFGVAVLPTVLIGLLVALIIALLHEGTPRVRPGADTNAVEAGAATTVFGILFWLFLTIAAGAIIAGYFQ